MKIVDLSHPFQRGMPVYPGDGIPQFREASSLAQTGFRDMEIIFTTHLGTHIDAPAHVIQGGETLDRIPVQRFFGPGCCLDVSAMARVPIEPANLIPFRELILASEFVLLHTGWSRFWGSDDYYRGFPFLSREAASWLAAFALKGIGIDAASPDSPDASHLAVHKVLLERSICLIENLTGLDQLPAEGFLFSCLPLKLGAGDGCPVRAAAILP